MTFSPDDKQSNQPTTYLRILTIIKLTCKVNLEKFLDTKLICQDTTYVTEVHRKLVIMYTKTL